MIATGGLLRINARRQDSLRSKTRNTHTHKKKAKKKRRSEVVVVKGKLKLCSVSGLVAALGILVLLVGVVMAALGYWPREGLFFSAQPQEGATPLPLSAAMATAATTATEGGETTEEEEEEEEEEGGEGRGMTDFFNGTENINDTTWQLPRGFLQEFLDRYLYSDRLKVFGPLIMGIGIFLFICANAVLHENRDRKTKVINLRDIYSTVIDLHSVRKPAAARRPSANPLNGLVNYVQSKSLEAKPKAASLLAKKGGGGGGEEGGGRRLLSRQLSLGSSGSRGGGVEGGETDAVFSIFQEHGDTLRPLSSSTSSSSSSSSRLPLHIPHSGPTSEFYFWTSRQKESLNSFTLPLTRGRSSPRRPPRRHSAQAGTGGGEAEPSDGGGEKEEERKEEVHVCPPPPLPASPPPSTRLCTVSPQPPGSFRSSSSLHTAGGSRALLLLSSSSLTPSHLSLSSLSHLLCSSSPTPPVHTPAERARRRSCPSGYSKLAHSEGESFESSEAMTETTTSCHVTAEVWGQTSGGGGEGREDMTSQRKYSNKEKLRMISQTDGGPPQEREDEEDRK